MPLFTPADKAFAQSISTISYTNTFLPDRIAHERTALGQEFNDQNPDWNIHAESQGRHANITRLAERAGQLVTSAAAQLVKGHKATETDLQLYEDLAHFFLYHQYHEQFTTIIEKTLDQKRPSNPRIPFYRHFATQAAQLLDIPGVQLPGQESIPHLFACFFQIRRAFHHIFTNIVGISPAASNLRAAAWESVFTHDLRRYRRALYQRMGDITTLITGPSGTGKELVARAIGLSRYIPFDPKTQSFCEDFAGSFYALSLSALSPTLIESELFGHRRGSFTGALEDRAGWLKTCRPLGAVFLDEVGEIDLAIQVKLLRVLQTRTFQRLGDTQTQEFLGKIIAATNRDLQKEMQQGHFREDFYYRLCSDLITTPSLHELLIGSEEELHNLVRFIAHRIAGDEAETLASQVEEWIAKQMPPNYPWPGNFRELEQCVRNVLVRGHYRPPTSTPINNLNNFADALQSGTLTADQLLQRYCTHIYQQTGTYEETARLLGIDRRTVKSKVNFRVAKTI